MHIANTMRTAYLYPKHMQVMYIDLDVHQGNGVARDKLKFKDEVNW